MWKGDRYKFSQQCDYIDQASMKSFYKELKAIDDRERKGYYNMLYTV